MKRTMLGLVASLGLVLASSSAAMAGEVNGNGDDIPGASNASSACAFSGLDTADSIENNPLPELDDDFYAERGNQSPGGKDRYHGVQSYGAIVKAGGKSEVPSPGQACRAGHGRGRP